MIKIKKAYLHNPIMVGGKNLGQTLPKTKENTDKLDMVYDRYAGAGELHVTHREETLIVPLSNVSGMVEDGMQPFPGNMKMEYVTVPPLNTKLMVPIFEEVNPTPTKEELAAARNAQVNTPMSHVFAGPGKGKTGRDK